MKKDIRGTIIKKYNYRVEYPKRSCVNCKYSKYLSSSGGYQYWCSLVQNQEESGKGCFIINITVGICDFWSKKDKKKY